MQEDLEWRHHDRRESARANFRKIPKTFFEQPCAGLRPRPFRSSSYLELHGSFHWRKASRGSRARGRQPRSIKNKVDTVDTMRAVDTVGEQAKKPSAGRRHCRFKAIGRPTRSAHVGYAKHLSRLRRFPNT